jgi:hypothetical protein
MASMVLQDSTLESLTPSVNAPKECSCFGNLDEFDKWTSGLYSTPQSTCRNFLVYLEGTYTREHPSK